MTSNQDLQFKGYAIHDTNNWDRFQLIDFKPKEFGEYDVDIKIDYCGVCASDVHTITAGWGKPILPVIPGHEIVGHVVRVGSKVTEFKVGDRAGVGPQVLSCFKCLPCETDSEQYCRDGVDTYNSKYPNGHIAQGGYSTAIRAHERFVFPLPEELPLEVIAPMLCAGLTVYSPLVRNGAGPGKVVGIVGIGGLGHLALQFARALGADKVIAFSHSLHKKEDAIEMGATDFVLTSDKNFADPWLGKVDLIINTTDVSHAIPLSSLLKTLKVHGRCILVALPDENLPTLNAGDFIQYGALLGGSHTGSKKEVISMLNLAVQKNVKSVIQILPMREAGAAVRNVKENKVHYRQVLKYVV
ncbi:NADPH-dependent alcohol dehydrogenase [Amanita rubescens]|nr:NADPH-dependent alcohol dehydrogenase [Amanita rubescens]KAF8351772.1 NADPH-dependent alcohol dehydrogenase [Amanita rubescens]